VKHVLRGLLIAFAAMIAVPMIAMPAHASAYRYWTYWNGSSGSWAFSSQGPSANVHDGDVIGWRFAVSNGSGSAPQPRATATSLCSDGTTVYIDYGVSSDAPPGERPPSNTTRAFCANDPDSDNGYRATAEHASLRTRNDGIVCGIDGYPKQECAPIVEATQAPAAKPTTRITHQQSTAPASRTTHSTVRDAPSTTITGTTSTATPGAVVAQGGDRALPSPTPTVVITDAAPKVSSSSQGGGVPVALISGVAIAVLVGGFALWRYRAGPR
jgi:hypothetical protein